MQSENNAGKCSLPEEFVTHGKHVGECNVFRDAHAH